MSRHALPYLNPPTNLILYPAFMLHPAYIPEHSAALVLVLVFRYRKNSPDIGKTLEDPKDLGEWDDDSLRP